MTELVCAYLAGHAERDQNFEVISRVLGTTEQARLAAESDRAALFSLASKLLSVGTAIVMRLGPNAVTQFAPTLYGEDGSEELTAREVELFEELQK